MYLESN